MNFWDTTLAHALRSLQRSPAYALTVILTLALGLAAVGSMVAVVHGVLLAPLPYAAPERLVRLHLEVAEGGQIGQSPAIYSTYRRSATQLAEVAMYRTGGANVWTGREDSGAEHQSVSWISPSTLQLLQVSPRLGRGFTEDEGRRGGAEAVILSDSEWRRRYGAADDVIGRTLIVNDVPREVIGVMPASFAFPDASTTLWLPAKVTEGATAGDFFYSLLGRLAPGATAEGAERELAALLPAMAETHPQLQSGGSTATWLDDARPVPRVQALSAALTGEIAPTLWMLAAVAGLVLLVAWANVTHLFLIRADRQRQNVALRRALGASALRASAQALAESLLLNVAAAVLALVLAGVAIAALRTLGPATLPRLTELGLGPWSAGVILLLALLSSVLCAALQLQRDAAPRGAGSSQGARSHTAGKPSERLRRGVTVAQIAGSLVVLAGSVLLARTAQQLHAVAPGFDAGQVTSFRILLPFARYPDTARVAFHARLTERVSQLPGVLGTGLGARLPLGPGHAPEQNFLLDGADRSHFLPVNVVSHGYFAALRIPLLAGRDFRPIESQRPDELVISQRVATTHFADPTGAASLGKTLRLDPGGPSYTIVGVVGDVRHADLARPAEPMVYRPQVVAADPVLQPGPLPAMSLVVRAEVPEAALISAVRGIVRDLDPSVPVFDVRSMADVVRDSMARVTLMLAVLGAAAAVTLLLGMIGLYGVIAYGVALRRREFGLRMALGATPQRIVRGVVGQGLTLTAAGITAGLLLYVLTAPQLRAAVYGVPIWDPIALGAAIALLGSTAALACWLPARHAAMVDPADALRAE